MTRDRVTPELRQFILDRDVMCSAYRLDEAHLCRDTWGNPHSPFDTWRLSLEHVKSDLRLGVRGESDARHLVALCFGANLAVPSKVMREGFREYLRIVAG